TRRANLLTWCVTTNDLAMSTDLASRAVVIRLSAPDRQSHPRWEAETARYIDEHRERIIADAVMALRGERHEITSPITRFTAWCDEVLSLEPCVNEVLPGLRKGIQEADADGEEIEQFLNELR